MTIPVSTELEERLERLAIETQRTAAELAQQAVEGYLGHVESLTAAVREGEESAERHGWLTHEEVFERLNKRLLKLA
jgi:predicted transcriptional regulator